MLNKEELQKAVEKCKKRIETNQCCIEDAAREGRKETREYYQAENSWLSELVSLAESVLRVEGFPTNIELVETDRDIDCNMVDLKLAVNKNIDDCLLAHTKIVGEKDSNQGTFTDIKKAQESFRGVLKNKDEEIAELKAKLESTGYDEAEQAIAHVRGLHSPWDFQNERVRVRDTQIKDLSEKLGALQLKRVDELAEIEFCRDAHVQTRKEFELLQQAFNHRIDEIAKLKSELSALKSQGKMTVEELGFIVFKGMNGGYSDGALRNNWTARHYNSVSKMMSSEIAHAIHERLEGKP